MKPDDVVNIFAKRHSCRNFSSEDVSIRDLHAVTKSGLLAPCAMGKHASHLFVFRKGEEGYNKLMNLFRDANGRDPFYRAPVIIIETLDQTSLHKTRDGSAVIENMLMAASMLNLGACWIHAPSVFFSEKPHELKKIDIPADYTVIGAVALGHEA